jgi:hypothetical protein
VAPSASAEAAPPAAATAPQLQPWAARTRPGGGEQPALALLLVLWELVLSSERPEVPAARRFYIGEGDTALGGVALEATGMPGAQVAGSRAVWTKSCLGGAAQD